MNNQKPYVEPETARLLAVMQAATNGQDFDSLPVSAKRAGVEAMFGGLLASAPACEITHTEIMARDGHAITTSIVLPQQKRTPATSWPVVFLIQGGGWSLANRKAYLPLASVLADGLNAMVVVADFRLAPEHKFPTGLHDCKDVYLWIRDNIDQYGGDPENVMLFGDSAGGSLATGLSILCGHENLRKPEALLLAYPMTDVSAGAETRYPSRAIYGGGDYFLTEASIAWAAEAYARDASDRSDSLVSSVLCQNLGDLPPTILITAGLDPLKDEGKALADAMKAAGGTVLCRSFEGTIHGFLSFFDTLSVADIAVQYFAEQLRSIR